MDLLRSDQLLEPSLFPAGEKGREAGKRKRVSPRAWGRHITCPSLFSPFARQRSEVPPPPPAHLGERLLQGPVGLVQTVVDDDQVKQAGLLA